MVERRETDVIQAFTGLADRLVDDYDVVEVTTQLAEDCARLLDVAAVGLLLADASGVLHLIAATSAEARELEAFQLQRDEGPCLDCYHTGAPVSVADLRTEAARWPRFIASAAEQGFLSVHAIPLRLRRERLGALGLFGTSPGSLGSDDLNLAQALAHVASIAIVQNSRTADRSAVLPALQSAVASRAVVEIAKGVVAQAQAVDMQEAFVRLREYARHNHQHLTVVARQVVSRQLPATHLLARRPVQSEEGVLATPSSRTGLSD
jgi:transcriptional regulator with GAF, ATPase, and Fis domain